MFLASLEGNVNQDESEGSPLLSSFQMTSLIAVGVMSVIGYFYQWKFSQGRNQALKSVKKPESITWLDEDCYLALTAICDTLFPSLSYFQCTDEKIQKALTTNHSLLYERNQSFYDRLSPSSNDNGASKEPNPYRKYLYTGALEHGTPKQAAEALQQFITKDEKFQIYLILKLLSTSLGCFLLTGYFIPFISLPLTTRETILQQFRDSRIGLFRTLFQVFKRLICVLYYSYTERSLKNQNPNWPILDYYPEKTLNQSIPSKEEENDDSILKKMICYDYSFQQLSGQTLSDDLDLLEVDAVIIGSGCGGGVMAGELVEAGYTVLVLEKGGYFQARDFARWRECEAMGNTYDKGGLCTSEDGSVVVLSGSCVGGGSTINWSASFRTPDTILDDWTAAGLTQFKKDGPFIQSMDYVMKKMKVNCDHSYYESKEDPNHSFVVNENNRMLWKASSSIGRQPEKIPRNVGKCVNCGSCCFGCSHKSKQSTIHSILEPILLAQYKDTETDKVQSRNTGRLYIIPDCKVTQINHTATIDGKKVASGVTADVSVFESELGDGVQRQLLKRRNLQVKSKVTICSAGSIYTPALLLKSRFTHPKIGKYLTLHPVLGCAGVFPDVNTGLERGVSMGVVVRHPKLSAVEKYTKNNEEKRRAERYTVALETPPLHLGILALLLPWQTGLQFKLITMMYPHLSVFIGITRDTAIESNRVTIDNEGNPKIQYSLSSFDAKTVLTGVESGIKMMYEVGASFILIGHSSADWFCTNQFNNKDQNDAALKKYIDKVWEEGVVPNKLTMYSAHQMSSCRMASKSEDGPTSPTGELYECENLFIADGSVLPTSLGINPMMTIEAFSHMISKNVIERLSQLKK